MSRTEPRDEADSFDEFLADWLDARAEGRERALDVALAERPEWEARLQTFLVDEAPFRAVVRGDDSCEEDPVPTSAFVRRPSVSNDDPTPDFGTPSHLGSIERLVGTRFGNYLLEEAIGRGGMGVVFRASQLEPRRTVALKLMRAGALAEAEELRRFEQEAQSVAALDHPGIVPVFEYGQIDGIRYLSMPCVVGESFEAVLKRGRFEPREAARVILEIADAVAYAHDRGIVHRDLKPSNVLVDRSLGRGVASGAACPGATDSSTKATGDERPSGVDSHPSGGLGRGSLRIADFGLAKTLDAVEDLTRTGQVMGTPGYMAPEQAWGEQRKVGKPADVYAIGAILYRALTERLPVEGTTFIETILKTRDCDPTPPRTHVPSVPRALEAICLKCLDRDPKRRYDDAGDLASDLRAYLRDEPTRASRPSLIHRVRRWNRAYPFLASHVWGLAFLIGIVQINGLTMGTDLAYHVKVTSILVGWLAISIGLQIFVAGKALEQPVAAFWLALDAAILTLLMLIIQNDPSQLLIGYPTLMLAAATFEKVRSVALMTAVTMGAHASLIVLRPELCEPWSHALLFQGLLLIMGIIAASLVRRIQQYRRIFEERF